MATKFIIASDLHQHIRKWEQLVRVVEQERPRFVLVAGALLPKDGGFHYLGPALCQGAAGNGTSSAQGLG